MGTLKDVLVPDIGDFKDIDVIEIMVKPGDTIKADDSLIALESDKATIEVPAPFAGVVKELKVKTGDKVSEGSLILTIEASDENVTAPVPKVEAEKQAAPPAAASPKEPPVMPQEVKAPAPVAPPSAPAAPVTAMASAATDSSKAHASPGVRRFARELGVDLGRVKGSGPKERIVKEDIESFVKQALSNPQSAGSGSGGSGFSVLAMPVVDFAKFGTVEAKPLSRIQKISGANLHRNWVTIPHITQNDEADITDLEAFRKNSAEDAKQNGVKLTLLAFLMKAVVAVLKKYPEFNASLDASGENLIYKKYFHIGVAVDTPDGLVVPVIRDVDQKSIYDLAHDLAVMSAKARDKKLGPTDMQGGCFSISSLGGIGGSFFTPIINAPEVAILGVSKSSIKPVFQNGVFVPRLILPLSLSYDHRVIDGAAGARFTTYLSSALSDIRRILL